MAVRAALLTALTAAPATAFADVPVPTTGPLDLGPVSSFPPALSGEVPGGYLFDLTGVGKDFGRAMADRGIYFNGRLSTEGVGQVSGGVTRGVFYEGFVSAGVDLDMNRIAGIQGAIIHFLVNDDQGQSYTGYSGTTFGYNRIFAFSTPESRLNELSWEQELFDNRLRFLAGRITPATDFDTSPLYCQFVTTICAAPAGFIFDKTAASYLNSAWGATMTVKPSEPTYVKFGLYEDEPSLALNNHNAWPGPDWGFDRANGAVIPVEIGYRTDFRDDAYPRGYDIGGFVDTGSYNDPLLNSAHRSIVQSGGAPQRDRGRSGVYLQAQQMVWHADHQTDRGLTLFAAANWSTSGETDIADDVMLGFTDKGLFAARPNDLLGLTVSYIGLNHRLTERIDQTIRKQGGAGQAVAAETLIELNYAFHVAPGINVVPFSQYIAHPDQFGVTAPTGNNTHSFEIGLAFTVNFTQALGLPQLLRGGY